MGVVALLLVGTEVHANAGAILQRALIRQCFGGRSPLFDMEQAHLEALVQKLFLGLLLPLLLFAVWLMLSSAGAISWLGSTWFFCIVALRCKGKSPPRCLGKETRHEGWDILGDGIVINVFLHFAEELGRKLHRNGDILYVKLVISHLDFIDRNCDVLPLSFEDSLN